MYLNQKTKIVKNFYNPTSSLPSTPASGDSYISSATANSWTVNRIYTYDGSSWIEEIPKLGNLINLSDTNDFYRFDSSSWSIPGNYLGSNNTWTGTNLFNNTVTVQTLNGFVKAASGVLSASSSIDISSDTNLAVSSPITLTGDTVGFAFNTSNTWTGTNFFNNTVTIQSLSGVVKASSGVLSASSIDISSDTNLAVSSPITLTGDTVGFAFNTSNTWTGTNFFNNTVTIQSLGGILKAASGVVSGSAVLDDLNDVTISSAATNQIVKYNGSAWVNSTTTRTLAVFKPRDGEPPTSNYATLNTRNLHPILEFDDTTAESIIFTGVIPKDYNDTDIKVVIMWSATSATSGTVRWSAEMEAMPSGASFDADSDAFLTAITGGTAAASPSGSLAYTTLTITSGSRTSITNNTAFRLRIKRDAAGVSGTDDMTGDAELIAVHLYE
jgi:hypothetical protein